MKKLIISTIFSLLFTAGAMAQNCLSSYTSSINGSAVSFTNTSTTTTTPGGSVYYYWNFDDGNTSTATNPNHTYNAAGTYVVCLNVYFADSAANLFCSDNYCDTIVIAGGGNPVSCSANFYSWLDTSAAPLTMTFGAYQQGTASATTTYSWDYGDGNNSVTSNFWHQYTYSQPGTYVACLTISVVNPGGQACTDSYCDTVYVPNNNPVIPSWCNASFYVDSSATNSTGFFIYNNSSPLTSSSISTSYYWDFGDGNSSTQAYPVHQYASSGIYNLCLTIVSVDYSTLDTCMDTYCHTIGVDSLGNVYYKTNGPGFVLNVLDPATIGLNENILSNLDLYPNPSNGEINLDLGTKFEGELEWSVFDLKGMELANGQISQASSKLDLSELNTGIYLINLSDGEKVYQHKLQIIK
tara:strand:+ start:399 stop:1628 length:1230 start_codon:yes stop_codon:yes gene_type:complete